MLGKILFILYIGFLLYFLIFSDWYGRTGGMNEYHYNLVLFKEIKRFWIYREQLGWVSFANLFGNVLIFMPFGFFYADGKPLPEFFSHIVLQFWAEPFGGNVPVIYQSGKF